MRNRIIISTFAFISLAACLMIGLSASSADRGQAILDDYGRHPANKAQTVKFHLALKLMTGQWSDAQKQIILRAINRPDKSIEADVASAFTREQAGPVFYDIGSEDITNLRSVYAMPFGKGQTFANLTPEQKARLWQQNFALGFVRYDLSLEQQQFLIAYAEKLPTIFAAERESAQGIVTAWDAEAGIKFTRTIGRGLFATVGKDSCQPTGLVASIRGYFSPMCVCTTNSGNWSCNDSCHGAGTCTIDPQNCGVLWLWDCNGMCNNGDMEIQ